MALTVRRVVLLTLLVTQAAQAKSHAPLLAELERIQEQTRVPAVGLVIITDRRPSLVTAWGRTGNPQRPLADADTPFRIGSITKTFTALTAMALVRQGRLSLEPPLPTDVAAAMVNPWQRSHPVRLVQLLELTAGLSDLSLEEWENQDPGPLTLSEALALHPAHRRALWRPGTRYSYSNAAAGLTALAIERAASRPFEAVMADQVLAPLGMDNATLLWNDYLATNLPRGYQADGVTEIPYWHMTFRAFGALSATPREMSYALTALIDRGRLRGREVIPTPTLDRMFHPTSTLAARAGLSIGYGLGVYGRVRHGFVFFGHGGDGDGFLSRYGLLPRAGRGYFVVITSDNPPALARMRSAIERHLVADLETPPPPPAAGLAAPRLERLEGAYYPSTVRFQVADWAAGRLPCAYVERQQGALTLTHRGRKTRLLPVSSTLFRRPRDPIATVAFLDTPAGIEIQGEAGYFMRPEATTDGGFHTTCDSQ